MRVVEYDDVSKPLEIQVVSFDPDCFIGKESRRPGRYGKPIQHGLEYYRRCVAARVAARQGALDLAMVVCSYEESLGRRWGSDSCILNDDRRGPIL